MNAIRIMCIKVLSIAIFLYLFLILSDWLTNTHLLDFQSTQWSAMVFNTALLFILFTVSALLVYKDSKHLTLIWRILLGCIILLSLISISEHIWGLNFGIDEFFVKDQTTHVLSTRPGSMAPMTSVCFIILSLLLLLNPKPDCIRLHRLTRPLLSLMFTIIVMNLIARLYDSPGLGNLPGYTLMATTTAFVFALEITLLLLIYPNILLRQYDESALFRTLITRSIPVILVVPILSWLILWHFVETGVLSDSLSHGLFISLLLAFGVIGILIIGEIIFRIDRDNRMIQEKYNRFFNISPDFLLIANSEPRAVDINETWEAKLGLNKNDLLSMSLLQLVHHEDISKTRDFINRIESQMYDRNQMIRIQSPSGKVMHIEWSSSLDSKTGLTYSIGRDITQRMELEDSLRLSILQAEEASRAKSEFLANMSHELRTPLNSIIGFSEILQDLLYGPLNEHQTEYVEFILQSSRHLLNLINDILDLSKIEAGKMILNLQEVSIRHSVSSAQIMVREKAHQKNIRISTLFEEDDDYLIQADERKIKQILYNLLSNAIKFTNENGSVEISVAHSEFETHPAVSITVSDNGIGIPEEQISELFQEFHQLNQGFDKVHEGSGLGLSLTRKLVKLHSGNISATSQLGTGSTFTVLLPVYASEAEGDLYGGKNTDR